MLLIVLEDNSWTIIYRWDIKHNNKCLYLNQITAQIKIVHIGVNLMP